MDHLMIPPTTHHLDLESDLACIDRLVEWFSCCWSASLVPQHVQNASSLEAQAQTALLELFNNAVLHAHHGLEPKPKVRVGWGVTEEYFFLEMSDYGNPFSPELLFDSIRELSAHGGANPEERERQWGLIMIYRLCENYGWVLTTRRSSDGINTIRLVHSI